MKVGMNLLLWTDQPNLDEHAGLLERVKGWGFDGVELPVDGMSLKTAASFATRLEGLQMGRTAIAALDASVADPVSPMRSLREGALNAIKRAIDNTMALGADVLCGPLFQGLGRFSGKAPEADEWSRGVEIIRAAGDYARQAGIRLALEPLNRFEMYMVNTLRDGMRFVQEVDLPNVGLLADTHHGNIEEADVAGAWREAAGYIYHVHISENNRGVPGDGHAVRPELFAALHEIGYDNWATIEAFSRSVPGLIPRLHLWRAFSEHPDDAARLGIQHIRRCLEAAERWA